MEARTPRVWANACVHFGPHKPSEMGQATGVKGQGSGPVLRPTSPAQLTWDMCWETLQWNRSRAWGSLRPRLVSRPQGGSVWILPLHRVPGKRVAYCLGRHHELAPCKPEVTHRNYSARSLFLCSRCRVTLGRENIPLGLAKHCWCR